MAPKPDSETLYKLCCSSNLAEVESGFQQLGGFLLSAVSYNLPKLGITDRSLVKEAVQDALEDIWSLLQENRGPDNSAAFLSWSAVIANRRLIDILRRQGRFSSIAWEEILGERDLTTQTPEINSLNPSDIVIDRDFVQSLISYIQVESGLSRAQKTAIIHYYFDYKDDAEVADLLETSSDNVRLIRFRGVKRLQRDEVFRQRFGPSL